MGVQPVRGAVAVPAAPTRPRSRVATAFEHPPPKERIGMSSFCFRDWVRKALKSIRSDVEATHASVGMINARLDTILERLDVMGAKQDAAMAKLTDDLNKVVAGWAAKDAQIAALTAELANADASAQARVDAVLAEDDTFDEGVINEADAIVSGLVNEPAPVEPPVEPTP